MDLQAESSFLYLHSQALFIQSLLNSAEWFLVYRKLYMHGGASGGILLPKFRHLQHRRVYLHQSLLHTNQWWLSKRQQSCADSIPKILQTRSCLQIPQEGHDGRPPSQEGP